MTETKVPQFKEQAYEVKAQNMPITDDSIKELRSYFGLDLRSARITRELTKDAIKQHCNMLDSMNPLFLDEEYAKKSRWGGIIAPPTMAADDRYLLGLRGVHTMMTGWDWEWFRVARPGDILVSRGKPVEAIEHQGRTTARMIDQIFRAEIRNQRGELVAYNWCHVMRFGRSKTEDGMKYEARYDKWSDEELAKVERDALAREVRGNTPRYWEDVKEGEEMKPAANGPFRTAESAFAREQGWQRGGAFGYTLGYYRKHPGETYVDPETGAQDHPHRGHYEQYIAREVGMPGIYDSPPRIQLLCLYVFDWMGDDAFMKKYSCRMHRPRVVGDVNWCKGKVVQKWVEGAEHLVELEANMVNQRGITTTLARAVISLPSRVSGLPPVLGELTC